MSHYLKLKELYKNTSDKKKVILHGVTTLFGAVLAIDSTSSCLEDIANYNFGVAFVDGGFAVLTGYLTWRNLKHTLAYSYGAITRIKMEKNKDE